MNIDMIDKADMVNRGGWFLPSGDTVVSTLTVGDFEKMRYNNESLDKLLVRRIYVDELGRSGYRSNADEK